MKYTESMLFYDLQHDKKFIKDIFKDRKIFFPIELPYMIACIKLKHGTGKREKKQTEFLTSHLYGFSFFISSHQDYKYNKSYLNNHIEKFQGFLDQCNEYFSLVLRHFNALIDTIDGNLSDAITIAYDGFLHFKHIRIKKKAYRWRAYIHRENYTRLAQANKNNIKVELLEQQLKPLLAVTFSEHNIDCKVDEMCMMASKFIKK